MIRIIPYSAVQLFAYETYKVILKLEESLGRALYVFRLTLAQDVNMIYIWNSRNFLVVRMGSSLSWEDLQQVPVQA